MMQFQSSETSPGINLAEYLVVLIRRRWLIAGIILIALGLGFMSWKRQPLPPFRHVTVIEIGTLQQVDMGIADINVSGSRMIETKETVEAKMNDAYIPLVLAEHAQKNNYETEKYQVDVEIPLNSNTVTLESFAGEGDTEDLLAIQKRVADFLIEDHQRITEFQKKALQRQKFQADLALEALNERATFFEREYKRLGDIAELLTKQIEETRSAISGFEKNRAIILSSEASRASTDQSLATTLLLIDNDIQKNREVVRGLEEQRSITLQNRRDNLAREEAEVKRKQREQQQVIEGIQFQIDNTRETRIVVPSSRLLRLPAKSFVAPLILSGVIGMLVGVLAAFFVEVVVANMPRKARS